MILKRLKDECLTSKEEIRRYLRRYSSTKFGKKTTMKRPIKWSKGKLLRIEEDKPVLIPTNHPSVNHLNLEEFAMDVDYETWYFKKNADCNPFVECFEMEFVHAFVLSTRQKTPEELVTERIERFHYVLEEERGIATLISLLEHWDYEKFKKHVEELFRRDKSPSSYISFETLRNKEAYLGIAFGCCENSYQLVDVVSYICKAVPAGYCGLKTMYHLNPYEYILFYYHLNRTNLQHSVFEDVVPRRDLLIDALENGDTMLMKFALELEWPSVFLPTGEDTLFIDFKRWPRRKDGLHSKSFNSLEFCAAFSFLTIWAAWRNVRIRTVGFVKCFKFLWRAVPVPYLPVEDMQQWVDVDKVKRSLCSDARVEDLPKVWTVVAQAFGDDFPNRFEPRSLKHLSRYAVRRRCRSPEHISKLIIPETLKQYLLLEF